MSGISTRAATQPESAEWQEELARGNAPAEKLYERSGYAVTNQQMRKQLGD